MSGSAGNTTVLPLVVVLAALAAVVIMLAIVAAGVVNTGGGSAPAWSGDEGPPGSVGLTPEHVVLRGGDGGS